uniref:AIG1-type G domain-containing protein n=1 Tax=Acrobeloides nanus TaxID=290746 RepID=A0A914E5C3_9BILA
MGAEYSFLAAEQKTWIEHTLDYDETVRAANLRFLYGFKDGSDIYLSYVDRSWGGISFQHWFVTDRIHFLEFGSADIDIYTARVTISTSVRYSYHSDPKDFKHCVKMDKQMRDRMRHVLGMRNYSLCLRNCEHVANYVFRGRWVSSQMDDNGQGVLISYFRKYMLSDRIRLVNSFPVKIRPHIFGEGKSEKLYSFLDENYTYTSFDYYLDHEENNYNVLVVGPTGAGKSHLINIFFNQKICDSEVSHRSVTKEIYFVRGRGQVYNIKKKVFEERNVVVADTIGLCDTEWDDKKIINLIRNRVSSNIKYMDAVFVVFRADRLLKEHVQNIKMILKWLKYSTGNNDLRFLFVGTYADYLTDEKKNSLRQEATEIFGLKQTGRTSMVTSEDLQSLVYTGFPPEDSLNDRTKEKVKESWESVKTLLKLPGNTDRINIASGDFCTIL